MTSSLSSFPEEEKGEEEREEGDMLCGLAIASKASPAFFEADGFASSFDGETFEVGLAFAVDAGSAERPWRGLWCGFGLGCVVWYGVVGFVWCGLFGLGLFGGAYTLQAGCPTGTSAVLFAGVAVFVVVGFAFAISASLIGLATQVFANESRGASTVIGAGVAVFAIFDIACVVFA